MSRTAVLALAVALGLAVSYGAAYLGHPTSVWMWRDMLGLYR